MAIAELTGQRNTVSGSATNAYPGNVTIGSLLVACFAGPSSLLSGVTASGAGSPTALGQIQLVIASNSVYLAWGIAAATGACTFALTGLTTPSSTVTEFTGASAVAQLPLPTFARATSTAPAVAMPGVPTGALVLGVMTYGSTTTTITPDTGAGWVQCGEYETYASNYPHSLIHQVTGSSGTFTPTWTLGASRSWGALSVVLLPPTVAAGGGVMIGGGLGTRGIGVF
jgi:hypothetical protein